MSHILTFNSAFETEQTFWYSVFLESNLLCDLEFIYTLLLLVITWSGVSNTFFLFMSQSLRDIISNEFGNISFVMQGGDDRHEGFEED